MNQEWSAPYEAPISLDSVRLIGAYSRRGTLWTFAAVVPTLLLIVAAFLFDQPFLIVPIGLWLPFCRLMAQPVGQRMPEYWFRAWLRHRRLPREWRGDAIASHHAVLGADERLGSPRGVVEVDTLNLRMTDDDTLGGHIKRLHAFYLGLRFPVQVVVRAWPDLTTVGRRWFIAVTAPTDEVLAERLKDIVAGLGRAGLGGHALNGDLYATLQRCWTRVDHGDRLGPLRLRRERDHVVVDGDEYVRALLLSKIPRTIDANWLAAILDGDLAVDFSLWLDPLDNADELDSLADRINEWETAQQLNIGVNGAGGRLGYRDPDLDDQINDAKRTRLLLRRRQLRVFQATLAFVVRGFTLADCRERERLLVDLLREHVGDDPLLPIDYEQDRAPLLAVPCGEPAIEYPLRIVSPALARTYPFSNSSVAMPSGVPCGVSIGSKRENMLDLFGLTNPHVAIMATTGAGKGFWVKVFLWRLLHAYNWDERVSAWIIQSEKDEYTALAESMEATALGARAEVVRLSSLHDVEAQCFKWSQALRPFRDLIVFDLTRMDIGLKGKAIARLLQMIEHTAARRRRPRRGVVVIDELGIVLRDEDAAVAIDTAYRRFRSIPWDDDPHQVNRVAMIGLTQRPSDLLRNPRAKALADLAETHLYLRQKSTDLRVVKSELHLSDDEVTFLETCEDGEALLVCGRARVGLKIEATVAERTFATT